MADRLERETAERSPSEDRRPLEEAEDDAGEHAEQRA